MLARRRYRQAKSTATTGYDRHLSRQGGSRQRVAATSRPCQTARRSSGAAKACCPIHRRLRTRTSGCSAKSTHSCSRRGRSRRSAQERERRTHGFVNATARSASARHQRARITHLERHPHGAWDAHVDGVHCDVVSRRSEREGERAGRPAKPVVDIVECDAANQRVARVHGLENIVSRSADDACRVRGAREAQQQGRQQQQQLQRHPSHDASGRSASSPKCAPYTSRPRCPASPSRASRAIQDGGRVQGCAVGRRRDQVHPRGCGRGAAGVGCERARMACCEPRREPPHALRADIAPPLHVSTTFERSAPGEWVYARHSQPTRARAERVLGALEGGECALYASGLAAVQAVMLHVKPRVSSVERRRLGVHARARS